MARLMLFAAALIVLYFVFHIFRPFLVAIAVALVLTSLSYPVFDRLCDRLKGRRSWAAFLTCLGLTLVIVIPFIILLILLANEVGQVYAQFQERLTRGDFNNLQNLQSLQDVPGLRRPIAWVSQIVDLRKVNLAGSLSTILQQASLFLLSHSTGILSGIFNLIFDFFLMVVTMFFLFRDGRDMAAQLETWSPISARYTELIATTFQNVARATIIGSLLTALAQGTAAGVIFWALGVSNALFWGTLSAFFSLVPVVGAALIWVPWALYFLVTGQIWTGILMIVLQSVIVGSLDNVLRPVLIEGRIQMHTMIVFFAIMGGISYFGVLGMIFGPIIVAMGLTLLEVYRIEFRSQLETTPTIVTPSESDLK